MLCDNCFIRLISQDMGAHESGNGLRLAFFFYSDLFIAGETASFLGDRSCQESK